MSGVTTNPLECALNEAQAFRMQVDALQVENAKLRKLVRDMHALATDHDVYVRYSYSHAWDEKLVEVEKQMHELGVDA